MYPLIGEPLYPELSRSRSVAFAPCLGQTGATLRDWSGYNRHSTLVGPTWVSSEGRSALSFDGVNDYADIPFAAFPNAYPFSLSCWVNVADTSTLRWCLTIADINTLNAYFALAVAVGGAAIAAVGDAGGTSLAQTTTTLTANTWNHVLAVFSSTTSRTVYLNGAGIGTNSTSRTPTLASLDNIALGSLRRSTVAFSQCSIDDVAVYPYEMTPRGLLRRGIAYELAPRKRGRMVGGFKAYWAARRALIQMAGST